MGARYKGQATLEAIGLTLVLVSIWLLPVDRYGNNLVSMLMTIVESTTAMFMWLWDDFLLQPMVL